MEARHLSKQFGGLVAVDDLSLAIHPGEIRGLIGPNGCGKTTTMNMMAGLYRPTKGDVRYNDESILKLPPHIRTSKGIMRTFQIPKLFSEMTVFENMLVPALAVLGIIATGAYPNLREGVTVTASCILIYLVSNLYFIVKGGAQVTWSSPDLFPGLALSFFIEPLGMLFSLVAGYLWLVISGVYIQMQISII